MHYMVGIPHHLYILKIENYSVKLSDANVYVGIKTEGQGFCFLNIDT